LYNEGRFDAAIEAAERAGQDPQYADEAHLIAARSHLELLRDVELLAGGPSTDGLKQARMLLSRVNPDRLDASERVDLLVGFGQALYFEAAPGAAAEVFESVLDGDSPRTLEARERVLDWWATARDRQARSRGDEERRAIYQTIRTRMGQELGINPSSGVAAYWLAAAAAGQGQWLAAWDAALAGWVRAPLTGDRGAVLRADLDRLIHMAVAPERARIVGRQRDESIQEWENFKARWVRN
jgi:hypothetical protein